MSPGKKHRYTGAETKTVAQIIKELIRDKKVPGNNRHLINFLSQRKRVLGRLVPETHAATSGTENTAESPSQSTKDTGNGSRSDIASTSHQSPKVSPNSPVTSRRRRDKLIPGTEVNSSTAVIALVGTSEEEGTGKKRFQSQSCSIPGTEVNSSTAVIAPVGTSEEEGTGKKRFQSQSCSGKKSRFVDAPLRPQPPKESLSSPAIRGKKRGDLIHDSTESSAVVIAPVEISDVEGTGKVLDASSICHQTPKQSPCPPLLCDRRRADLVTEAAVSDSDPITLEEMSQQAVYQTARDEFVQELKTVVEAFENNMPTGLWYGHANNEQLDAFLTQFDEKIKKFREEILQSVSKIAELQLSPILNVSALSIFYSNVLHAAVNAESKRRENEKLLEENSSNPDVENMTKYYNWCWRRFEEYHVAYEKYLKTLPETFYPKH